MAEGGRDIPRADLERRFARSLANFVGYATVVDPWRVFDNTNGAPKASAEGRRGCLAMIGEQA